MRSCLVLLSVSLGALLLPAPASGQASLPADVHLEADLRYGAEHERQALDLYWLPETEAPAPLVVCIHGGGWRQGSKADCRRSAVPLLERGYAVAAVNYRLSQHATFPAQIADVKAAVRWLRAHAEEYNLDSDRFGAWGGSAGGHLAALLGTAGDVEAWDVGDHPDQPSRVQAVGDRYGPTDFLRMNDHPGRMDHDAADSPESRLIGGPIQENPEAVRRANPITYVTPDDPPFLIMHGKRDELVPYEQSELLHAALDSAGVTSELILVDSLGHGGTGWRLLEPDVHAFFDEHLRPDTSSSKAVGQAAEEGGRPSLRVSESGRFLVAEGGEPFFWLGDTAWKLFVQLDRDEAAKYLWDRKNKQFTVIQAHLLGWAIDEENAYGEAPFIGGDFDRPNEAYWRHADHVIDLADSLDLHMALLPAWGRTYVDDHQGNDAPRPLGDQPEKAYRYARFLGERYGDRTNVVWVLGGDVRPERHAIYEQMAQGLADGGGGRQPRPAPHELPPPRRDVAAPGNVDGRVLPREAVARLQHAPVRPPHRQPKLPADRRGLRAPAGEADAGFGAGLRGPPGPPRLQERAVRGVAPAAAGVLVDPRRRLRLHLRRQRGLADGQARRRPEEDPPQPLLVRRHPLRGRLRHGPRPRPLRIAPVSRSGSGCPIRA